MRRLPLLLAVLSVPAHAVDVDGHIHPDEWRGARHIVDFRQTQPLTGKPAALATEAWVMATPKGLAVAFRLSQPPGVPRTLQRVQRDFQDQVDRVDVMVDFDGDGRTGHVFAVSLTDGIQDAVVTDENQIDYAWDGLWTHAVSRDADGWSVEMLIPWYSAPMHRAVGDTRRIGLYLDRVIGSTGERDAWPVASSEQPRFLSDFGRVEVRQYSQSLLAITPYVSALRDDVRGRDTLRQGADIFWKPGGQFQLTATLNPDFGQAESDDLVVNFDATENFFSEKRPFFTENHGIFDFPTLSSNSQLIYTRRVGGPADDGNGLADINAAIKANGSFGHTDYGVLAADERGPAGRFFGAARLIHDFGDQRAGVMLTRVNHPWLDRQATVLGLDDHWQPNAQLTVQSNLFGSGIVQQGKQARGYGGSLKVDYTMRDGWRQQWMAVHFDDRFQLNDFGYLQRNDYTYAHWMVDKRITDLPADSIYSSHEWHALVAAKNNGNGLPLVRQLNIYRGSTLRNGATESLYLNVLGAHWDDLLTRGGNALFLPPAMQLTYQYVGTRHGDWAFEVDGDLSGGGLSGNRAPGYDFTFQPTYFVNDAFNLYTGVYYEYAPDWLVWQHDDLIGRFAKRNLQFSAGFNWSIGHRQELRMKLQAIGLNATLRGAYRVGASGRAVASSEPVDDFSVRDLGLQIRYRYELAPLSYLYVVYGRGGYVQGAPAGDASQLLRHSFALRDSDQLLVKLSYRFGL